MRYLDLPGVSPSSAPELALNYVRSLNVSYNVPTVDITRLQPGDVVVTGPWGQWGWLPGSIGVEIVPDGGVVKREPPLLHIMHRWGVPVGLRLKPPGVKSKWWALYNDCLQWVETVANTLVIDSSIIVRTGVAPYTVVTDVDTARRVIAGLHGSPYAWDLETDGLDPRVIKRVGLALANATHAWWIIDLVTPAILDDFIALLHNAHSEQRGSNLKFDCKVLWGQRGLSPTTVSPIWDTQIMAWLLQCGGRFTYSNDLKSLAKRYLHRDVLALDDVGGVEHFWEQSYDTQALYAAGSDARNSYDLVDCLRGMLDTAGLLAVYTDIEQPVIPVLAEMELQGLHVDRHKFMEITRDFIQWEQDISAELSTLGFDGRMSNDNHIAEYLYAHLGLPILVRTEKLGRGSVAVPVLQRLYLMRDYDPIVAEHARAVELFMEGSAVDKALNTFCIPVLASSGDTLYKSIAQTSTVTGRLAGPTMQVPGHGRRAVIREAYTAPDGMVTVDSDYAQIEPRLGAHYSQDTRMLRDFREGRDVYMSLGNDIGLDITDKHDPRRQNLKTIYLADMYIVRPPQIQTIALRQGTYIPLDIAREYQNGIHKARPEFFQWRDGYIEGAREAREARDMFGRRRLSADLHAIDPGRRGGAERETSNFPEQAGAGGILKLAMPGIQRLARSAGGSLVNAVHDELVQHVEAMTPTQETEYKHAVAEIMEHVYDLSVPLVVETGVGHSWKDAKA